MTLVSLRDNEKKVQSESLRMIREYYNVTVTNEMVVTVSLMGRAFEIQTHTHLCCI